mmetsp:Transcript_17448/g.43430  ORF Transcript_17448/g.43430 Transcript_17448/m.43430 type:complete len:575 (+) Transcript_17448:2900-4624(+)
MLQFGKTMQEERHWTAEEAEKFALTWLGFVDDLVTKGRSEEEAQFALQELAAACRFVGLELNTEKTEAMSFGLLPARKDNEQAMMERIHDEDGEKGWLVEYDGIDLRPEWKEKARQICWKPEYGRPTHWLAWESGRMNCCAYGCKGWVHTDRGQKFRVTRLGMRQYVKGEQNKFICPRCGDVLADARALLHHRGSGFCRVDKTDQQLRQLRIGRQQEEKQKVDRRKKVVVPVQLSTQDGEIGTVGAFKYLGTLIDNAGRTGGEVTRRAGIATATVGQLRRIWRSGQLRPELKAILYESLAASVALYNAETWTITAADWGALRRFQLSTLRTVAGEQEWTHIIGEAESTAAERADGAQEAEEEEDRTSRWELCKRLGIAPIEEAVREKRVAWAAHALRDAGAEGSGERIQRECARKTEWGKQLAADLEHYGLTLVRLQSMEAAAVREVLVEKRQLATGRKKKGRRRRSRTSGRTKKMREDRRINLDQIAEERRQKAEQVRQLLEKINNKKWARVPNAGVDDWQLVDDETVKFRVSLDDCCENTGREYRAVEHQMFYKARDGRYKIDDPVGVAAIS